jgi:hypothetical protein
MASANPLALPDPAEAVILHGEEWQKAEDRIEKECALF